LHSRVPSLTWCHRARQLRLPVVCCLLTHSTKPDPPAADRLVVTLPSPQAHSPIASFDRASKWPGPSAKLMLLRGGFRARFLLPLFTMCPGHLEPPFCIISMPSYITTLHRTPHLYRGSTCFGRLLDFVDHVFSRSGCGLAL